MADSRTFLTMRATRFGEKVSVASAVSARCPRIDCATRLSLRGLVRMLRPTALACTSESVRFLAGLPIGGGNLLLRLAVAGVTMEGPGRGELAEFVTDHVFGDDHGDMLQAVIDAEGEADELRQDGRAARPDLDHVLAARIACSFRLLQDEAIDKWAFPNRTSHRLPLHLPGVPRAQNFSRRALVLSRLSALGRLAPGRHRMTAAFCAAFAATMGMIDRVHRRAAHRRAAVAPDIPSGFGENLIHVVGIGDGADRRLAFQ